MSKLNAEEIIEILKKTRPRNVREWGSYGEEPAENWADLTMIGIEDTTFLKILGEIEVVKETTDGDYFQTTLIVWYFKDHDVYIQGNLDEGSYGHGFKLETWTLKEVFPKKVEVTIYE